MLYRIDCSLNIQYCLQSAYQKHIRFADKNVENFLVVLCGRTRMFTQQDILCDTIRIAERIKISVQNA